MLDTTRPLADTALAFAKNWIAAWNARDVEGVLDAYAEDVIFTSPTAIRFVPGSDGTIIGKAALRRYWTIALAAHPELRFELRAVYAGTDTLVIDHESETGARVSEVLTFEAGRVVRSQAAYEVISPCEVATARPGA